MAKIESLGSFETGHAKIDRDHLLLVDLINRIEDALQAANLRSCNRLITNLLSQLKSHFKREEAIIFKIGFPDAARHRDYHEDTFARAKEIQIRFTECSDTELMKEIFRELQSTIIDEIVKDDLDYKPFLNKATKRRDVKSVGR